MKNFTEAFGIIVMTAVIGMMFIGCDTGNEPGGGTPKNSGAVLANTSQLGGIQIGSFGTETGSSEADPILADAEVPMSNQTAAVFAYVMAGGSEGAAVTAYADDGTGGGTYAALKAEGYDFSGTNDTLWVKAVSEDSSETLYYRIAVEIRIYKKDRIPGSPAYFDIERILFGTDGTYTIGQAIDDEGDLALDEDDHYDYITEIETGTYTCTNDRITITPKKIFWYDTLLDRTEFKNTVQDQLAVMVSSETIAALLKAYRVDTINEFIDLYISQSFAVRSYSYLFTTDDSLLMQEELPAISSPVSLSGTYDRGYEDEDDVWQSRGTYEFSADGTYSFADNYNEKEGTYTAAADDHTVYFKVESIYGKTIEEYYETAYVRDSYFINEAVSRASSANEEFRSWPCSYDIATKRILLRL